MAQMHRLHQVRHEKRQRTRSSIEEEPSVPVRASTTRRVRTSADPDDLPSTTRRNTLTSPIVRSTPVPVPSTTTSSTTTPPIVVAPRPSTTSATSSDANANPNDAANDANNRAAGAQGTSNKTGLIVGVVIAVLGALALAALLVFFIRKRKARRQQDEYGGFRREKADDEQSFIGAGGLAGSQSGEKFGMSSIGHGGPASQAGWANSSDLSYVHTPAGSQPASSQDGAHAYHPQDGYGADPHAGDRFMPPQAMMMTHPADRLSVANPYTAAQISAQGGAGMPAIAEDSPFEDPQWANKLFAVSRTFQPSMPDELIIMPGDRVRILMAYDDGWCLGENLDSVPPNSQHQPVRGVFPRDCVEEIGLAQQPISSAPSMPALADAPAPVPFVAARASGELPPGAAPGPGSRSASPVKGADLQRAPTLPPLDVGGRASQTFAGTSHLSKAESSASIAAVAAGPAPLPTHLSSSSSLNQEATTLIGEFPAPLRPTHTPTASADGSGAHTPVKRSSSLIAGKDKDLFAALDLGDGEAKSDELK